MEIKNFAIIDYSLINFEEGFNVITGETGAGKSILLDALLVVLGGRTNKNYVRKGKEKSEIKVVFLKTDSIALILKKHHIECEDDYIIFERQVMKNGRSIAKINGRIETSQTIRDIAEELIEITGQKEHQELKKEDRYLAMIDLLLPATSEKIKEEYKEAYEKWKEVSKSLKELTNQEREKEQLLDLYRFQKREIEEMNLEIGEDEALEEEKKVLGSFEKISTSIQKSIDFLYKSDDLLIEVKELLEDVSSFDKKIEKQAKRMEEVYYEIEDIKSELVSYMDDLDYDEERLNEIIERLNAIKSLKRKYGDTIEEIQNYYNQVSENLSIYENKEERIEELKEEKRKLERLLFEKGEKLHSIRLEVAKEQTKKINKELKELCMPHATFQFEVTKTDYFTPTGITKIQALFTANKGEDLKPLSKVASGGELSRILLAIKSSAVIGQKISTVVFDEIDEGIGGEVGRVIGEKIKKLGETIQVISISHLPQVAAKANNHYLIQKETKKDRTVSKMKKLNEEERKEEIARMIYGDEKNEITLKQAEEMLK